MILLIFNSRSELEPLYKLLPRPPRLSTHETLHLHQTLPLPSCRSNLLTKMSLETVPKDEFPLFHLLELVSTESHTSDIILNPQSINKFLARLTLKPEDVQGWCLSRIADYRSCIRSLRAQPDSAMYNASFHGSIVQLKSNMCALRSTYSDAAPIHRSLPPEILLEIFANFHHDGTRRGNAASRVCHCWHALLLHTAPFWRSLLGQEFLGKWEPPWKADRFRAAFVKSAPLDLSLCLRGIHPATVDILSPHSHRISSMAIQVIGYSEEREPLDRFLQLDMPILRELEVRHGRFASYRVFSHIARFKFSAFPHLRTLRLSSIYFKPAEASHTELRHLELKDCLGVGSAPHTDLDLQTILGTIRNCPNLETLCIAGRSPNTLSDLDSPVDMPRLRHIILRIPPGSTRAFLSRLVLPLTTRLDLEPRFPYAHDLLPLPLSTSLVTPLNRPPVAEVAMHLKFGYKRDAATWETQGAGSRPLRVSTFNYADLHSPDTTLTYTGQVVAIFAPGTTVTSLTIAGARRATSKPYWTGLLAGLPHLVRLAVDGGDARDDPMLFPLLAKPQEDGVCLCPMLADLSVFWDEEAPDATTSSTTVDASYPSPAQTYEAGYPPLARTDEALFRQPYGSAETHAYCRVLDLCLRGRAKHGCRPLHALSVSIWDYEEVQGLRGAGREGALTVEAMLREGLRDLVEEVSVELQSRWEV